MQNISFIGIGLMGFPMAKNLLKSGFNLRAYNRSQDKADRLKEFGAEISTSIKICQRHQSLEEDQARPDHWLCRRNRLGNRPAPAL